MIRTQYASALYLRVVARGHYDVVFLVVVHLHLAEQAAKGRLFLSF